MAQDSYKTALIVGTGSGLSASLARLLARNGLKVALAARSVDKLAALISEGKTGFEAARAVFAADFAVAPTESLSLLSATGLLIEALLEASSQTESG